MDYTFKKSTCERYDIRWDRLGWAIITIDENGGMFNAQSDYGSYAYSWPNHGRKSFKHFILELAKDPSYFLGKVSNETWFAFDKAVESVKRIIIEKRREKECAKEQAREAWEEVEKFDDNRSYDLFCHELYESNAIHEISPEPWYEFKIGRDYPPGAIAFAKEVMPMLAEIIKQELSMEAQNETPQT